MHRSSCRIPKQPHTWQGRETSGVWQCLCCKASIALSILNISRTRPSTEQAAPTEQVPPPTPHRHPQRTHPMHSSTPRKHSCLSPTCCHSSASSMAASSSSSLLVWLGYPWPHCPSLWDTRQDQPSSAMLMENTAGASPVHLAGLPRAVPLPFDAWHMWKCSLQRVPAVPSYKTTIWETACLKISKHTLG